MESNTGKKHVKLKLVKCFSCFSDHVAVPLTSLIVGGQRLLLWGNSILTSPFLKIYIFFQLYFLFRDH